MAKPTNPSIPPKADEWAAAFERAVDTVVKRAAHLWRRVGDLDRDHAPPLRSSITLSEAAA